MNLPTGKSPSDGEPLKGERKKRAHLPLYITESKPLHAVAGSTVQDRDILIVNQTV